MKTNYINQFKRNIMQDENFHCMPDNEQTTNEEQSVHISMNDAAKAYKNRIKLGSEGFEGIDFKAGWKERENQLLPIIKEMGEALKEIDEANNGVGGVISLTWLREFTKTTLDKYKNYL